MTRLHEKLPLQYHPRKIRPPNQYRLISKSNYRVAYPFKGKSNQIEIVLVLSLVVLFLVCMYV